MPLVASRVASVYAESLLGWGVDHACDDALYISLQKLENILRDSDVVAYVANPWIPSDLKANLLAQFVTEKSLEDPVKNFLMFVFYHRRGNLLLAIIDYFNHLYFKRRGTLAVHVTSSSVLSPKDKKALGDLMLTHSPGYHHVDIDVHEDPNILGGVIAETHNHRFDNSWNRRLSVLHYYLKETL